MPPGRVERILAPLLTGKAQETGGDLLSVHTHQYPTLKLAVTDTASHSCNPDRMVWAKVSDLAHKTLRIQVEGEGPPLLEQVVLDRCVRALSPSAKKCVAEQGPWGVDNMIAMLKNHQVMQEML